MVILDFAKLNKKEKKFNLKEFFVSKKGDWKRNDSISV